MWQFVVDELNETPLVYLRSAQLLLIISALILLKLKMHRHFSMCSLLLFVSDILAVSLLVLPSIIDSEDKFTSREFTSRLEKSHARHYFQLIIYLICQNQPVFQITMVFALIIISLSNRNNESDSIFWVHHFGICVLIVAVIIRFDFLLRSSLQQAQRTNHQQSVSKEIIDSKIPQGIFVVTSSSASTTYKQSPQLSSYSSKQPTHMTQPTEFFHTAPSKDKSLAQKTAFDDSASKVKFNSTNNQLLKVSQNINEKDFLSMIKEERDREETIEIKFPQMSNQIRIEDQNNTANNLPDQLSTKRKMVESSLRLESSIKQDITQLQQQKVSDLKGKQNLAEFPLVKLQQTEPYLDNLINSRHLMEFPFFNASFQSIFSSVAPSQYEEQIIHKIEVPLFEGEKQTLFDVLAKLIDQQKSISHSTQINSGEQSKIKDQYVFAECLFAPLNLYFDIQISPCFWDDNIEGFIVIFNDISQRITNQRLRALDKYKDDLLANVSHDFKTPLNGMAAQLQMVTALIKANPPQKDADSILSFLNQVEQNVWMLNHLVNDIQDYSQMGNQTLKINAAPFVLSDVVREIYNLMKIQTDTKNIEFNVTSTNELEKIKLNSDKIRLKQILINLLSNAIKFTYEGSILFSVTVHDNKDPSSTTFSRPTIEFVVEDTGVGMTDEVQKSLFQMYSTHDVQQLNPRGVGLGLFISKCLVTLLGPFEQIFVQSAVGSGSKFRFFIYQDLEDSILQEPQGSQSQQKMRSTVQSDKILKSLARIRIEDVDISSNQGSQVIQLNHSQCGNLRQKSFERHTKANYNSFELHKLKQHQGDFSSNLNESKKYKLSTVTNQGSLNISNHGVLEQSSHHHARNVALVNLQQQSPNQSQIWRNQTDQFQRANLSQDHMMNSIIWHKSQQLAYGRGEIAFQHLADKTNRSKVFKQQDNVVEFDDRARGTPQLMPLSRPKFKINLSSLAEAQDNELEHTDTPGFRLVKHKKLTQTRPRYAPDNYQVTIPLADDWIVDECSSVEMKEKNQIRKKYLSSSREVHSLAHKSKSDRPISSQFLSPMPSIAVSPQKIKGVNSYTGPFNDIFNHFQIRQANSEREITFPEQTTNTNNPAVILTGRSLDAQNPTERGELRLIVQQQQPPINLVGETTATAVTPSKNKSFVQKSVPQLMNEVKQKVEETIPGRKMRLLYAEDQPFSVIVMTNFFNGLKDSIELHTAFNGQLALNKILEFQRNQTPFDGVFMDANMPVLDGPETIQQINSYVEAGLINPMVVVTCTAYSDRERFIELGSNYFLSKPISLESVLEALLFILSSLTPAASGALTQ